MIDFMCVLNILFCSAKENFKGKCASKGMEIGTV